ncbi:MAG: hypothetical protein A6D91_05190 [Bacillaceae bacterium G1]|nr:hypothetical protein [Bacillota bacterium]OJF16833.1 MAG: hypothetical protein A6D91_05190 [Bacillaceae bacterium G1]
MNEWSPTEAYQQQKADILTLQMGADLYERLCTGSSFAGRVQELRKEIFAKTGVFLPPIRIRRGDECRPDQYQILLRGQLAGEGTLFDDPEVDPAEDEEKLLDHIRRVCYRKLDQLLSFQSVVKWLEQAKTYAPELVQELFERGMTPGLLWSVLRILIRKRYPLHPFEELLEWVLEYYLYHPYNEYIPPQWTHRHPEEIAEFILKKRPRVSERSEQTSGNVRYLQF